MPFPQTFRAKGVSSEQPAVRTRVQAKAKDRFITAPYRIMSEPHASTCSRPKCTHARTNERARCVPPACSRYPTMQEPAWSGAIVVRLGLHGQGLDAPSARIDDDVDLGPRTPPRHATSFGVVD